jgi:hypothetical protein
LSAALKQCLRASRPIEAQAAKLYAHRPDRFHGSIAQPPRRLRRARGESSPPAAHADVLRGIPDDSIRAPRDRARAAG